MKTFCLALDLKNDESLIAEYEKYHEKVWPEVEEDIRNKGIVSMEIFRVENRLFMIMKTNDDFDINMTKDSDLDPKIKAWEDLMWKYQQALPNSKPDEKWRLMTKIFDLNG